LLKAAGSAPNQGWELPEISIRRAPASRPSSTDPGLVGRDRDLDILRSALSMPPSLAIVEGEAGIGKSRLVRELAHDPALAGMLVLIGQCEQLHEPFPLGPVLDALQQAAPAIRPERLGAVTGALAPLMPEIAHLLPPPPPAAAEPGAARHQVFRAATALLEHVGPVVLVLEDAHWADSGTFDLLTFLAFHQPIDVAVLLTTRAESGPLPVVEAFARAPAGPATVLKLAPLDSAEVRELARRILGVDLSPRAADELREKTGGIPFVLEEVLRTLRERLPDSPDLLDSLAVPTALRDVMLQRLSTLDPVAREIVGVASVLARRVDLELLAAVAERSTREVVGAIASAQTVGLLQDENDRPQFRHALAQQVVYESLPATSRRWLHERAATSISQLPGAAPSARLAYHSKRAGNTMEFVRHAKQAADLAVANGDDSAAARFLLEVVDAGDVPLATRLRLAARLGRVAIDGLAHTEAFPILTRLLDGGSLEPAVRGELRFALGRMLRQQGRARDGFEQIRLSLPDLHDRPALAAKALAVLAAPETVVDVHVREHTAWCEQAGQAARMTDDPAVDLAVLIARASLLLEQGDPDAWGLIDEVRGGAELESNPREHARACLNWAQGALHIGHIRFADALLAEAKEVVARADYVRLAGVIDLVTIASDFSAGRWKTIAGRVDAFVDQPAEFGGAVLDARSLQGALLASTGSVTDATRTLRSVIHDAEELGVVWPLLAAHTTLARLQLTIGELEAGRQQAALALGLIRAKGLWAWAGEPVQCIVEASMALDDVAQLEPLIEELGAGIAGADAPLAHAALLSCRAIMAERVGDAEVERMLAEAESMLHGAGARLAEGRATERLGGFRLSRGEARGRATLESALGIFGELGARRDFSRVSRTMREQGIAIPSRWRGGRRSLGVELSEREREVAELAAAGLTNKEIAAELFLSMRTVESHISKALHKLGTGSRRDLPDALQGAVVVDGA
jgi:DNA-binding CsgD family transcriptional regulator